MWKNLSPTAIYSAKKIKTMATPKKTKVKQPRVGSQNPQKRREEIEGNSEQHKFSANEQKNFSKKSGLPYKEEEQKKKK